MHSSNSWCTIFVHSKQDKCSFLFSSQNLQHLSSSSKLHFAANIYSYGRLNPRTANNFLRWHLCQGNFCSSQFHLSVSGEVQRELRQGAEKRYLRCCLKATNFINIYSVGKFFSWGKSVYHFFHVESFNMEEYCVGEQDIGRFLLWNVLIM